ncbi:MAG: hypothetical protein IPN01_10485 [Deltaproteobacteria bacterium]|nr:hypothetical protein [Deltaproteobacteria bacterium]
MSFWSSLTQTFRRVFGGDAPGPAPSVAATPPAPPVIPTEPGLGALGGPQPSTAAAVEVEDDDDEGGDDQPDAAARGGNDELELELEDEEERAPITPPVVAAPTTPRWSPQPGPRISANAPIRPSPAEREDNELTELEVSRGGRNPAFTAALGGGFHEDLDPRQRQRVAPSPLMPTAAYDDEDEDNRPTVIDQVVDFHDEPATDVDVFGTSRAAGISAGHRRNLADEHDEDRATFADYIDDAPAARVITNDYTEDEDAGAFDSGELDVGIYARALGATMAPPAPTPAPATPASVELDDDDLDDDDDDDDDELIAPSAVTTFRPRLQPSPTTRDADEDPVTYDEELFSHQDLARTRTAAKAPPARKQAQAWSPELAKPRPAARPAGAPSMSHTSAPTLVPDGLDDLDDLELETEEVPEDAAPMVAPTSLPELPPAAEPPPVAADAPLAPLEESDEHTDFAVEDFSWTEDPDPPSAPAQAVERYRNSLNIPDAEVVRVLRAQHFPSAGAAPDDLLHQLAQVESGLLDASASLGHRFTRLLDRVSRQNELWQSAVWWSGVYGDRRAREALAALREQGDEPSARAVAWAVRPYLAELIEAAGGARDDARVVEAHGAVEVLLGQRRALAKTAPAELRADLKRLPTEPRGLDEMPGFRWLG